MLPGPSAPPHVVASILNDVELSKIYYNGKRMQISSKHKTHGGKSGLVVGRPRNGYIFVQVDLDAENAENAENAEHCVLVKLLLAKQVKVGTHRSVTWMEKEDDTIIKMQQVYGNKWLKISNSLPGRTNDAVKHRWKHLEKKLKRNSKK